MCGGLDPLLRRTLVALITADVHNRDITETMVSANVDSPTSGKFFFALQGGLHSPFFEAAFARYAALTFPHTASAPTSECARTDTVMGEETARCIPLERNAARTHAQNSERPRSC